MALQGLRTGLASVSQITADYQAFLVFTPKEVFAIPKADLEGILRKKYKIGKRDATGLYIGHVWDMTEVLTTEKGFQKPITSPVGATMTALERHAAEGRQVHYALAVRQRSQAHTRRHPIPRRVKDLSGQLREGEGRQRRRGSGRVGDVYPSKNMTVGRFPLRPPPIRNTSTAQGAPEQVRFIDLCCGIGGFTSAGILAGWKPVASIDYCKSWAKRFHWNYSHPFVKANICNWKERNRLVRTYKNIDVCLFSPPCQPYSTAGLKRSGGKRSKVVGAGLDLILGWKPSLVVIECAALSSTQKPILCTRNRFCRASAWQDTMSTWSTAVLSSVEWEFHTAECSLWPQTIQEETRWSGTWARWAANAPQHQRRHQAYHHWTKPRAGQGMETQGELRARWNRPAIVSSRWGSWGPVPIGQDRL